MAAPHPLKWLQSKVKRALEPRRPSKNFESSYDIKETMGVGAYSTVKRAISRRTGEQVAVKIYDKMLLEDGEQENIEKEVETMRLCVHPNIVQLKDCFHSRKEMYIVMELMSGGELLEHLKRKKFYSEREASRLFGKLADAVAYMHSCGFVHRDLKPENILFSTTSADAEVKIADFGFARKLEPGMSLETPCGTYLYAAPEIVTEQKYSTAVDIWSLGVILYMLLCGFPPFYDASTPKLLDSIEKGTFSFPHPYWTNISKSAKDLVARLLERDPMQRITAAEIVQHPWVNGEFLPPDAALLSPAYLQNQLSEQHFKDLVNSAMEKGAMEGMNLESPAESSVAQRRQARKEAKEREERERLRREREEERERQRLKGGGGSLDSAQARTDSDSTSDDREKDKEKDREKDKEKDKDKDKEKKEKEKQERERVERERVERERQEKERQEREKLERERLKKDEKLERERLKKEKREQARLKERPSEKDEAAGLSSDAAGLRPRTQSST